tara:strand:- start:502 stop:684 length:183 start_codon:yes stop_codon:yes gene_type:complete
MSDKKEIPSKLVDVSFDVKKLGISDSTTIVYGVTCERKDGKLVGKCSPEELKAFKDGGRI